MSVKLIEQDPSEAKRIEYIDDKLKALTPRLSYLRVTAEKKVPGLEIFRDKVPVLEGTKTPVDLGTYTLSARAPGYKAWSQTIQIQKEGEERSLQIPPLTPDPIAPPASASASSSAPPKPPAPPPSSGVVLTPKEPTGSSRALVGWSLSGVGLLAGGVGAFFGMKALSSYDSAKKLCPDRKECSPTAMQKRNSANSQATIANIAIGGGLVLLGAGAYLLLTRGSEADSPSGKWTAPWVTAHGAGILMQESF